MSARVKFILLLAVSHSLSPGIIIAHEGVTPFDVLTNMRREGTGPYASPGYKDSLSKSWLGISAQDVTSGKQGVGVLVTEVRPDSPADRGDLKPGDVIIKVNSFSIHSVDDLELLLSKINQPGEYSFTLVRDGKEKAGEVYLEANLREMDPEMHKLIMEKRGGFEPGMLQQDVMRGMFGSSTQEGTLGTVPQPFTPGQMMQRMLERSPMGRMEGEQTGPDLGNEATPLLPLGQTGRDKLTSYIKAQLAGYLKYSQQLQLFPTQRDKLQKLNSAYQKHLIAQGAKIKVAELELEEALSEDKINLEAAVQLTDELTKLRQEDLQQQLEFLKESQQIITNEQQAQYQQLIR